MPIATAQISVALFADRKVRRLQQLVPERDSMAALGYWLDAVLVSWADEEPGAIHAPDDLLDALKASGLADPEGNIPAAHLAKAMRHLNAKRDAAAERQRRFRESRPVTPRNAPSRVTASGHSDLVSKYVSPVSESGEGVEGENLTEHPARRATAVLQWFASRGNRLYIDPIGDAYLVGELARHVDALGTDEVISRLDALEAAGELDGSDRTGYVWGIVDRNRKRSKPKTDDDEVDAAIARRKARRNK